MGFFVRIYMRVCKKMVIYLRIKRKYTWQKNARISSSRDDCKYTWEKNHICISCHNFKTNGRPYKSTLNSLKSLINVFRRKPLLGAPEINVLWKVVSGKTNLQQNSFGNTWSVKSFLLSEQLGSLRYCDYGLRLRINMLLRMIKTCLLYTSPSPRD